MSKKDTSMRRAAERLWGNARIYATVSDSRMHAEEHVQRLEEELDDAVSARAVYLFDKLDLKQRARLSVELEKAKDSLKEARKQLGELRIQLAENKEKRKRKKNERKRQFKEVETPPETEEPETPDPKPKKKPRPKPPAHPDILMTEEPCGTSHLPGAGE